MALSRNERRRLAGERRKAKALRLYNQQQALAKQEALSRKGKGCEFGEYRIPISGIYGPSWHSGVAKGGYGANRAAGMGDYATARYQAAIAKKYK